MIMRRYMLLFAIAGLLVAADTKDDAKDDPKRIQGTWSLVAMETNGEKAPEERIKKEASKLVISADKITVRRADRADKPLEFAYKIDPTKKPKTMDVIFGDGPRKGETQHGIYELDGDTLKVCGSDRKDDRPAEFVTKPDSGHMLMILKRDKP